MGRGQARTAAGLGRAALSRFARFAAIDWSGARGERQAGIAVALCGAGDDAPVLVAPARRWSRADALAWLADELPPDTLVGLDLSPGLPFDPAHGFFPGWTEAPRDAIALWALVDTLCADDPHLAASSFVVHPEARRHFRHGKDDQGDRFVGGAGRLRETERRQRALGLAPSSCFNLVGAAQVGKSSLTGMRVLHRLRGVLPVWPFDPLPAAGSVIVEVYTSLAARAAGLPKGRSKLRTHAALDAALAHRAIASRPTGGTGPIGDHASDAILTAAWLRRAAGDAALWRPAGLAAVAATEGWIFGVP